MFFMRKLILLILLFLLFPLATAQLQPSHPGLNFTSYDSTITQLPGTTAAYSVNVTNTGDVRLDDVSLTLSFLPSFWYETGISKPLDVGQTGQFTYTIKLPSDASGSIDLDLTAHGIRGFGEVSASSIKIKLILANVRPTQTEATSSTTPTIPTETTTVPQSDMIFQNSTFIIIFLIIVCIVALLLLFKS
jgi:hypothetical protein